MSDTRTLYEKMPCGHPNQDDPQGLGWHYDEFVERCYGTTLRPVDRDQTLEILGAVRTSARFTAEAWSDEVPYEEVDEAYEVVLIPRAVSDE